MDLVPSFGRSGVTSVLALIFILATAITLTALASSAYHRERIKLGNRHFQDALQRAREGHEDEAAEEFRKALLFSPDQSDYRLALGEALVRAGRYDEAQAHLNQLQQDDPTNRFVNIALGDLAVKRNRLNEAVEDYQRAVYQYWPASEIGERRRVRWELVALLDKANRRSQATGELLQLYGSSTDDQQRVDVGFALLEHGAWSEAAHVFETIEKANPRIEQAHRGLGLAYFATQEYERARHEFQRALALDPKDQDASAALKRTNAIIDMDPTLPSLNSAERVRRSENLLKRVLADTEACAPPEDVASANDLLNLHPKTETDLNLTLQQMAIKLWTDSAAACLQQHPDDLVELVLSRMGNE